jgi:hypothetical protein
MKDPRSLLVVYNECAAEKKEPFRFDPALADAVKVMGGADPRPARRVTSRRQKAGADPYAMTPESKSKDKDKNKCNSRSLQDDKQKSKDGSKSRSSACGEG